MKYDELRRLALRLATHLSYHQSSPEENYCMECEVSSLRDRPRHTPGCPIAKLEAEEAAPKKSDAQQRFEFVAKGIELGIFDERDMMSEYKAQLAVKTAGEFEGEY